jgi:hypothetical protein
MLAMHRSAGRQPAEVANVGPLAPTGQLRHGATILVDAS